MTYCSDALLMQPCWPNYQVWLPDQLAIGSNYVIVMVRSLLALARYDSLDASFIQTANPDQLDRGQIFTSVTQAPIG